MNRLLFAALIFVITVTGFMGTAGAQPAKPYISNFEVDYFLSRDDEGRSTLDVTERITAEFNDFENKGIVREIPREYDGHSVSFELDSITRNGMKEPIYSEYNQGEFHVIETGTDEYINGTQVFELTYSMRDVTRNFADTNADEFYWDINGTGWRTSIEKLSANLTVDEDLRTALSGEAACYQGGYGSSETCQVAQTPEGFRVNVEGLSSGENVTLAVGFAQQTFMPYQPTLFEKLFAIWVKLAVITGVVAFAVIMWFVMRAYKWTYRDDEVDPIAPEYLPPKNASVAAAAAVSPGVTATSAAELTDLAVRRYIQIIETREKSFWRPADYSIEVKKDISGLREEEREILSDMYGHSPNVGERLALKTLKNNTTAFRRFTDNDKKLQKLLRGVYGLKHVDDKKRGWFSGAGKVLLVMAIITLSPPLLVAGIIAIILSKTLWVLSDKGLSLRRYLKGLEMYIKVAEKDRLQMLQSPDGAQKVGVGDPTKPDQIVKLYEKVLPYAVLFGQEKQWSKQLGEYYASQGSSPQWYTGRSAFNAAAFSSAMTSFSGSVSATAASSSSSGGSGGGGFSGGGGGGGGGGFR